MIICFAKVGGTAGPSVPLFPGHWQLVRSAAGGGMWCHPVCYSTARQVRRRAGNRAACHRSEEEVQSRAAYSRTLLHEWYQSPGRHIPELYYTSGTSLSGPAASQSMKWIELKRSSPVQIHEPLILIQSNPADDPEAESSLVQSGHNRVGVYQIPCKIYM